MEKTLSSLFRDEKDVPCHLEVLSEGLERTHTGISSVNKEFEKRLTRKLDLRIVPILWLMFMLAFLDRTNVCLSYPASPLKSDVLT